MISNPVYKDLLKLGLVNKDEIQIISNKTRDIEMPVYIDKKSGIIFLERYEMPVNYYQENASGNPKEPYFLENGYYPDDLRRFNQFKDYISKAEHLVDFGCEWGGVLNLASNECKKLSGIELNNNCLDYLNNKFPKSKFFKNLDEAPSPDLITCFHVFEHIPEQLKLLKKFKKALEYGGTLILEVPHARDFLIQSIDLPEFRSFIFWHEHLVLHTKDSLKAFCDYAGFSNYEIFGYQRYGYTNHLGWMLDRKPNGHEKYANLENVELENTYKNSRVISDTTDTLILIARKEKR